MTAWQPIETAPKDGTPVLLWVRFDHPAFRGRSRPEAVTAKWHRPGGKPGPWERWALVQAGGYADDDEICGEPALWAPIIPPLA